jgi:leucyl/phenylalanyl-tRNA--protein transferase
VPFFQPGPDPDFPFLGESDYFSFASPKEWEGKVILIDEYETFYFQRKEVGWDNNIIAIGGNLSPGMLLSAYEQGIFPWFNSGDPVLWQSPDPRFVIFAEKLHVSSSMRKILKNRVFDITFNRDFEGVIKGCSGIFRPGQDGTWITCDIIEGYTKLHRLGFAHSAEAWRDGELAGGCYGVLLGRAFFGESMFARESNASKAAFLSLAEKLFEQGLLFIDCQTPTRHLASLGGEEIPRGDFLELLKKSGASRTQLSISLK